MPVSKQSGQKKHFLSPNDHSLEAISQGQEPCPSCGSKRISIFYEMRSLPVHSVLLLTSREEAINYPKGHITLGFCQNCGFISNFSFDPSLHEYSSNYEETQGFSPTFNAFARNLAVRLIDRYDLHSKVIIEIGCGKGEFITMLCELGGNRGVGFDPAYVSERGHSKVKDRITFIQDFYSEKYASFHGDFVCCRMTLEHIQNVFDFVSTVRRSTGKRADTVFFFQVPDVTRILHDCAFEDIYYEHCSYFSVGSLARLFQKCGFDVLNLQTDYNGQYLMIEAKPASGASLPSLPQENDLEKLKDYVSNFHKRCQHKIDTWLERLRAIGVNGQRAVVWGSGSKGVAFLTTLKIVNEIEYVVDINPYRQGTFMAGTGQEIVPPEFLLKYRPDIIIIMNPVYRKEIREDLARMGLAPKLLTL